jgi:hypothetical protein
MAFDLLMGREPSDDWREKLDSYEETIRLRIRANQSANPPGVSASSADLAGDFSHPAYGTVCLRQRSDHLEMCRGTLAIRLREHRPGEWSDPLSSLLGLHEAHPWDLANPVRMDIDGGRARALDIPFEPAGAPIRFTRVDSTSGGN